jgi:hypothetical protein
VTRVGEIRVRSPMGKSIKKLTVHIRSEAACQERTWFCWSWGMLLGWRAAGAEVGGADDMAF